MAFERASHLMSPALRWLARRTAAAVGSAIGVVLLGYPEPGPGWPRMAAALIVGISVAIAAGCAEGVSRISLESVSGAQRRWMTMAASLVSWYLGGGVGFVSAALVIKHSGCAGFPDMPVRALFAAGGKIALVVQSAIAVWLSGFMHPLRRKHMTPTSPS